MSVETKTTDPAPMVVGKPQYDVKDLGLADKGKGRIEWAENDMPVPALHP